MPSILVICLNYDQIAVIQCEVVRSLRLFPVESEAI